MVSKNFWISTSKTHPPPIDIKEQVKGLLMYPYGCLEQTTSSAYPLVFIDDGVYELVKGQQTKGIGLKNFSPSYRALDGYDVEKLYVDQASLDQRGLTEKDLLVPVEVLDAQQMGQLMAQL